MSQTAPKTEKKTIIERPPVVTILGHIDHGKSTLLDYIRKSNIVDTEIGGITQKISAYEIEYSNPSTKLGARKITFIDTPGHEAFQEMRKRGAKVADIAILVVSAEDGVKPQTIEAYKAIEESKTSFIVAINKIDKPNADINKTKVSLAEAGIYLEGFGGSISFVPISAKTGEGVNELLDLILLSAEVANLTGDSNASAEGVVIETSRDQKKGISATLIIKNGTLRSGAFIVAGKAIAPTRIIENSQGKKIIEATFSSPVVVTSWSESPKVGSAFKIFESKKEAEKAVSEESALCGTQAPSRDGVPSLRVRSSIADSSETASPEISVVEFPIIVKADVAGSLEAIMYEIAKIKSEKVILKILNSGTGNITESDVKFASGGKGAAIIGFNVSADASATVAAERIGVPIMSFDIIYKLSEWLEEESKKREPKITVEEIAGTAKIIRFFSKTKDRQIVGAKVVSGEIHTGHKIKIIRNSVEIESGIIRGLEQAKQKTDSVREGFEFGTMIEAKLDLAPGDIIQDIVMVEK